MSTNTPQAPAIDAWLAEAKAVLAAEPRVRSARILTEAADHLREASTQLEATGLSPQDAAQTAITRLGSPRDYVAGFRRPGGSDWLVEAARLVAPLIGWLLVALGALAVGFDKWGWVSGAGRGRGHGVRVWRTCPHGPDGECTGPWVDVYASAALVSGIVLIVVGLVVVGIAWLIRRRYSSRELLPRAVTLVGVGALAALGAFLLVGGAIRSALDASWSWVPFWSVSGLVLLAVAAVIARRARR